jgi:hypothetical protein
MYMTCVHDMYTYITFMYILQYCVPVVLLHVHVLTFRLKCDIKYLTFRFTNMLYIYIIMCVHVRRQSTAAEVYF